MQLFFTSSTIFLSFTHTYTVVVYCQGSEFKTTVNCELLTELFSQLFYSSSIVFCFEHSLEKAPTLLLSFIHVANGHVPFNSRYDTIGSGPKGLLG